MFQGVGTVQERALPESRALRAAILAWAQNRESSVLQGAVIGASWRWGARVQGHMSDNSRRLAVAINRWATAPGNPTYRLEMLRAMTVWSGGGMQGMGEFFAPSPSGMGEYFAANGMGEYFAANGMGEYFSGMGEDAATVCSPECTAALDTKRKSQLAILVPGALAMGLLAGMFVFR